jgi:cob(I)alamin adenosyltransferase
MLYTRRGDDGTTGLFGTAERFAKSGPLYEALGTVDELNSLLGLCRATLGGRVAEIDVADALRQAQEYLFVIQAELAGAPKTLSPAQVEALEAMIEHLAATISPPRTFVIAGATALTALLDYARAVARRAERAVIRASVEREITPASRAYLNRLSSFLYAAARYEATRAGVLEEAPTYSA